MAPAAESRYVGQTIETSRVGARGRGSRVPGPGTRCPMTRTALARLAFELRHSSTAPCPISAPSSSRPLPAPRCASLVRLPRRSRTAASRSSCARGPGGPAVAGSPCILGPHCLHRSPRPAVVPRLQRPQHQRRARSKEPSSRSGFSRLSLRRPQHQQQNQRRVVVMLLESLPSLRPPSLLGARPPASQTAAAAAQHGIAADERHRARRSRVCDLAMGGARS